MPAPVCWPQAEPTGQPDDQKIKGDAKSASHPERGDMNMLRKLSLAAVAAIALGAAALAPT
jgi:hypothetical protein